MILSAESVLHWHDDAKCGFGVALWKQLGKVGCTEEKPCHSIKMILLRIKRGGWEFVIR